MSNFAGFKYQSKDRDMVFLMLPCLSMLCGSLVGQAQLLRRCANIWELAVWMRLAA